MMNINRREALKISAAASASLLLPSTISCQQAEGKKLGVALVGLGIYSTRQLGPALQHTEHCELVAIVTGTPSKAETWQKEYGIPASHCYTYETFDQLKDNPDVDIIYVVLPNFLHAEYTIRAA